MQGFIIPYVFFKFIFDSLGRMTVKGCTVFVADWQTDLNEGFGRQFLAGQGK